MWVWSSSGQSSTCTFKLNTNIGKNVKECLIQPTGILLMHWASYI